MSKIYADVTGQKFNKLLVNSSETKQMPKGKVVVCNCTCDCGNTTKVLRYNLTSNGVKSCGHCRDRFLNSLVGTKIYCLKIKYIVYKLCKRYRVAHAICECDCGKIKSIRFSNILKKKYPTKSCGCFSKSWIHKAKTHGLSGHHLYKTWACMLQRCYNHHNVSFHSYGGRGIKVCHRWKMSFQNFYDDILSTIGDRPSSKHSLDRVSCQKNYAPDNVKWSTPKEQARNRRNNRRFQVDNHYLTIPELCEIYHKSVNVVKARLRNWKSIDRALKTPVRHKSFIGYL